MKVYLPKQLLRAYMDESVEQEEEVIIEDVPEQPDAESKNGRGY